MSHEFLWEFFIPMLIMVVPWLVIWTVVVVAKEIEDRKLRRFHELKGNSNAS